MKRNTQMNDMEKNERREHFFFNVMASGCPLFSYLHQQFTVLINYLFFFFFINKSVLF